MKRFLSLVLASVMLLSLIPAAVFAAETITKIEISGFTVPVIGASAPNSAKLTVPDGAPYHLEDVRRYDDTAHHNMYEGTFESGHSYSLGAKVVADEGFEFDPNAQVILNGGTFEVLTTDTYINSSNNSEFYVWGKSMQPKTAEHLTKINIYDVKAPVVGKTAWEYLTASIPSGIGYSIEYARWVDRTDNTQMSSSDVFEEGRSYAFHCLIRCETHPVWDKQKRFRVVSAVIPKITIVP